MLDRELDTAVAQQQQMAGQPPPPSPEEQKVQADIEGKQAELQMKQQSHEMDMAFKQQTNAMDRATKIEQMNVDRQLGQQKVANQVEMDSIKAMQQMAQPIIRPNGGGSGPRKSQ